MLELRNKSYPLWDAYTGKHKRTLSGHLDNNFTLTFSPDGKSLISCGKTTQLWDVDTGKNISTLSEKSGAFPLMFSPDSKILYGDFGGNIEIWDIQLRQRIKTLNGHNSNVTSMALSPIDESPSPLKITALKITDLILSDKEGKRLRPTVRNEEEN